ncbi:MAG: hypothetical protein HYU67_05260 [Flavobacteriia bacterium]|nr:hypothetical protein [Flavobacteriia bacterium]
MEIKILKAGMENTVIIDNDFQKMFAFYNYDEAYTCLLNPKELKNLINSQPKYRIKFHKETDTLFGLTVKKATAINPDRPFDPVEIWYTNDISLKKSNWFNGFKEIPGVLLKYHIIQNGIKMEFSASKINEMNIKDSIVEMKRKGKKISYSKFDDLIDGLFETFK